MYEIAGQTLAGVRPADLVGKFFTFDFEDGLVVPLGLQLTDQGGKPRLVIVGNGMQVQRQLAAMIMLPPPRRDNNNWGVGYRDTTSRTYVIDQIQLAFVGYDSSPTVVVVPEIIELRNAAGEWFIDVAERRQDVEWIWQRAQQFPPQVRDLIVQHRDLVTRGQAINNSAERIVQNIASSVGVSGDPVPTLMMTLHEHSPYPDQLGTRQQQRVWRQIIRRRGQQSFRNALFSWYGHSCQITGFTGDAALEAAHIVPYSAGMVMANDPTNGLLLRADIHTLFDLSLVKVEPSSLRVRIMAPLLNTSYMQYHDTTLTTSSDAQPSREALVQKWQEGYRDVV